MELSGQGSKDALGGHRGDKQNWESLCIAHT